MAGEVALITGGSRGIGRAVAISMAKLGRDVIINYSGNEEAAKETAEECMKSGVKAVIIQGNVASEEASGYGYGYLRSNRCACE